MHPVPDPPWMTSGGVGGSGSFAGSTPARMRLLAIVTATIAVLLALFGWIAVSRRDQALDRTGDAAARLISVQQIRSAVIEADSIATTSFLLGGLEPADQRARYESRLADAAGGLALLFDGQAGNEREQLVEASSTLNEFSGLVEQARANNRQGFPVGAAYQRQASALVRTDLLVSLSELEQQARAEVNDNIASAHQIGWLLPLAGLITLAAMASGGWWLFQRTRRILNVPLTLGAVICVAVVGYGLIAMGDSVGRADDAVTGDLFLADRDSQARVGAFQARSDEALTLINRGNGTVNEQGFQQARSRVDALVNDGIRASTQRDLGNLFDQYVAAHETLRALDTAGDWDGAVALLIGDSATLFDNFSADIETSVTSRAADAQRNLADASSGLSAARWAILIGALSAAALVAVGYGQRLREYR